MMRKFFAFILVFALVMSFGTAHATVTTITYTIDRVYNGNASYSYYLKGSDGTSNLIHNSGDSAHSEVTIEMGDDVTFKVAAAMIGYDYSNYSEEVSGFRYFFNFNGGTSGSYNFTFTSKSRYVSHVEIIGYGYENGVNVKTTMETHNEAKICTMQWVSEGGTTRENCPGMFIVTYSDSPAYKITYNLNGGTNSVSNPYAYEPGTAITLAEPTRTFYYFIGWYDYDYGDNVDLINYPSIYPSIKEISAGQTGEKTLYAKWIPERFTIFYELNGGTDSSSLNKLSYTVETKPFELHAPTRGGYQFMGWYKNENFSGSKITEIRPLSILRDITLYAKWQYLHENPDGSIYNPYKITSEADLIALRNLVNGIGQSADKRVGLYYQQTADIVINETNWTPIGTSDNYFSGNYDGGGFTISGINIDSTNDYQGLFGSVRGTKNEHYGLIQNIVLDNSSIKGGANTGGIVGRLGGRTYQELPRPKQCNGNRYKRQGQCRRHSGTF